MKPAIEGDGEFLRFPDVLRDLVLAELAAGNGIVELGHGFPAAPCGAYVMLAKPVSTRPREKTEVLDFHDRNGSNHSGEFTDATRHFFVLEPPHDPEPPPDMDAIRARLDAGNLASASASPGSGMTRESGDEADRFRSLGADADSIVSRFRASMVIDYDKWREGIGYDVDLFSEATPEELKEIEDMLIARPIEDWRVVQALAALGTERSNMALTDALAKGNDKVRMAILSLAPELVDGSERIASLVRALENADLYGGLSEALDEIGEFHPPEVMDALLRGIMTRDGAAACHFAAMLYYIHGKSASAFDWDHRPFFLRFTTEDPAERESAARELFAAIGVNPGQYIQSARG